MPRKNSTTWNVGDNVAGSRLQAFNLDVDDLYSGGSDRGRIWMAASATALKIDIAAFAWRVGTVSGQYAGGTDITVTNTATNYVEIDSTGTIQINTSAFTVNNGRLGTVTCAGGVVTAISIWKPDVVGGALGGANLVNIETLSGSRTLITTDKYHQILDGNATDRNVTLDTSGMVESSTFFIKNAGTSILTIKQASTVLYILTPGRTCYAVFDATNWNIFSKRDNTMFGDGSDGIIVWSADTNIDPTIAEKEYATATLNSGKVLSVSSVNRVLVLHTVGDVTINGTVDLNGKGGPGGAAVGAGTNTAGTAGTAGKALTNDSDLTTGAGGAGGGTSSAGGGGGGGGGSSMLGNGLIGTAGGGSAGAAGVKGIGFEALAAILRGVVCGAGGASGGLGSVSGTSGKGGDGGGALVWMIGGNLTLGASSIIQCDGQAAAAFSGGGGGNGPGGSGGGGAGTVLIVVAGTITDGGVTVTAAAGASHVGDGSGNGGAGKKGKVIIYSLSTGKTIVSA